jgi:hypothetical protein
MTSTADTRDGDVTFEDIHSAPEWQPCIQLIDGWYRQPLSPDTGVPAEELSRLERAAGRPLPDMLWEWYRLSGRHERLDDQTVNDYEVPLGRVWEEPRYLRVYGENQDNWYCGILNEHLEDPDPPVYFDSRAMPVEDLGFPLDGLDLVDGHFICVSDTLSEFLLGMTVRQLAFRDTPSPFFRAGVCGAQYPYVPALVRLQLIFEFPAGFNPYMGEDVLHLEDWGFAARTPEALARLQQAAREAGGPFPALKQPGQSNPHDSIWVAK